MTPALVGKGREADILALDSSRVLRQYREPHDVEIEARAMEHARAHGVPVPTILEVRENGLVMDRVEGPTMLAYAAAHPWQLRRQARVLARLHDQLHAVPGLPGLPEPFGPGGSLLHRDLHPDNVLLGPSGPVIIDWSGACNGPAAADVARTWILVGTSEVPGGRFQRTVAGAGRTFFLRSFLNRAGRDGARPFLEVVGLERLQDENLVGGEAAAIRALLAREAGGESPPGGDDG